MKIHIVELKYIKSEEEIARIRPAHREFLDIGYKNKLFLASGPKEDKSGGVILAVGDINEVKEILKDDPFYKEKIAEYSFTSFNAVKSASEIASLL
ncbi:YciI family protein [Francisella frigiditurris]|uniref:YCII-related domain protein n=1 Tax=Francisella frigiditurris TaxID=1542390 RepID=A0A1J0KUI5_9GAMM|nr:YciI family protein [Francisella frigiditurris]APC97464.1 YCII-related domain protein [Francisella frigiditurris]